MIWAWDAEPQRPFAHELGVGEQVGLVGEWDGVESGAEGQRQAEEGAVQVERRWWGAPGDDGADFGHGLHQRDELGQHLDDDGGSSCFDPGDVAAKLQGVAQALLLVQQNGFAGQRRLAQPQGLGVGAHG